MITQSVTLSNVKYKNGTKFQSWINANQPFRNQAHTLVCCVRCLYGQQQTSHETNLLNVMRKIYCFCSLIVGSSHVKFDLWPLLYEHVKTGITCSCNKNQIPIHHCNLRSEISSFSINFKKSYYYREIVIIINLAVLFWLTDIWEVWKGCEVSRQHVVFYSSGLKLIFWMVAGHDVWPKKFILGLVS